MRIRTSNACRNLPGSRIRPMPSCKRKRVSSCVGVVGALTVAIATTTVLCPPPVSWAWTSHQPARHSFGTAPFPSARCSSSSSFFSDPSFSSPSSHLRRRRQSRILNSPLPHRRCSFLLGGSKDDYESCETGGAGVDGDDDIDTPSTGARILDLAIPALIGLAIDPLMTIADTAFVGRYSPPDDPYPLAGLGSAAALLIFSFYVFSFLATATAPLVANRRASDDQEGAVNVSGQALSLALFLGTVLCAALLTFQEPLLEIMGTGSTGPEADAYAVAFLSVRALAAPAVLTCSAAAGIFRGYLDARTPTVILLGSNVVNLVLDVVLVANMGMGPRGAAIATTTAEWIAALCFLGVLAGKLPSAIGDESELGSNGNAKALTIVPKLELPEWMDVRPLAVASGAVFLRSIVLQVAMSSAAAMAARSTAESAAIDGAITATGAASSSVAAHQIALQLWLLCSFVCDALAAASQALVADGIGRNDADAVRSVSRTVFVWGLGLGLLLSSVLWAGVSSGFLIEFFTSDAATREELGKLLTIVILAQPLNSFVFAADGVIQGAEEFAYQAKTMALSVFVACGFFVTLQYVPVGQEVASLLGGGSGGDTLVNVWYSLIALQFMRALTSTVKLVDKQGPIDLLGEGKGEIISR